MRNKIIWLLILIVLGFGIFFGFKNFNKTPKNSVSLFVSSVLEKDEMYDIHAEYPQFKVADESFNKEIKDLIEQSISSFKENSKSNWDAIRETSETLMPENPFYFEATWTSSQINNDYISFVIHIYRFEGGAHGNEEVYAFNYDVKNKKKITFKEFLGDSQDSLNKISELTIADLKSQILTEENKDDDFLKEMIEDGAGPNFENYEDFSFDKNKLTIYFQKYQVAPSVYGIMEVDLYKFELEDIIKIYEK